MICHDKENNAILSNSRPKGRGEGNRGRPTVSETDYDKWVEAAVAPSRPLTEKKRRAGIPASSLATKRHPR